MDQLSMYTIHVGSTLLEAAKVIRYNNTRSVIVTEMGRVLGTLSQGDILDAILHGADPHGQIVNWFNINFKYLKSNDYELALELVYKTGISLIPVIDDNFNLIHVITTHDIYKFIKNNMSQT
jgi:CBS domain-containing protein